MVSRLLAQAFQTTRHQLSIARSRSGPSGADSTSAIVMLPRFSCKQTPGHSRFRSPSFQCAS